MGSMGSSMMSSIVMQDEGTSSDNIPHCFVHMAGLSSFHMSEYLALITVLENHGSGLFLFVITCCCGQAS
jgi:hypothetical protein